MSTTPYNQQFFAHHEAVARTSARAVIPLVAELVAPRSVVDVGCGVGTWLAEFKSAGIDDVLGIDGEYINRDELVIPREQFTSHDLTEPLALERRFDLAVCLEVAEHLPEEKAEALVASLVSLAPVVLFSAAIPFQGGNDHVNEQWPEYWQQRFAERNYVVIDCLREPLWRHKDVAPWYAQNLLVYVDRDRLADYPRLADHFARAGENPRLSLVHPEHYSRIMEHTLKELLEAKVAALRQRMQLRSTNLVVFPNWRLPSEVVAGQLRSLLRALITHPASARLALVVNLVDDAGGRLLVDVARELLTPGGVPIAAAPCVAALNATFPREQWSLLLTALQWRVSLPNDDAVAIVNAEAGSLPAISVEAIARKQALEG